MEDLFSLEGSVSSVSTAQEVVLLPLESHLQPGQPVQLCRVQKRLVGVPSMPLLSYLPPADAILAEQELKKGKAHIQPFVVDQEYGRRLLVAGCDPGLSVLGRHLKSAGFPMVIASCSSSKALDLLKQRHIHVAGSHLRDEATGESNLLAVRELFPSKTVTVVNFAAYCRRSGQPSADSQGRRPGSEGTATHQSRNRCRQPAVTRRSTGSPWL